MKYKLSELVKCPEDRHDDYCKKYERCMCQYLEYNLAMHEIMDKMIEVDVKSLERIIEKVKWRNANRIFDKEKVNLNETLAQSIADQLPMIIKEVQS